MWWDVLLESSMASDHVLWAPRCQQWQVGNFHGYGVVDCAANIDMAIAKATKTARRERMAMVGSVSYGFPGRVFEARGAVGVQQLTQAAARATATRGAFGGLVVGGSMTGPQGDWAESFQQAGVPVVHVVPACSSAIGDLKTILFEADGRPRERAGAEWYIVIVGENFSERNVILANLASQYCVIGGGPGTLLEVTALRRAGAGLLPVVGTGGLVEGMEFNGQGLTGLQKKLLSRPPPPSVDKVPWETMVQLRPETSFQEYLEAVEAVFGNIEPTQEPLGNTWPLTEREVEGHSAYLASAGFAEAVS